MSDSSIHKKIQLNYTAHYYQVFVHKKLCGTVEYKAGQNVYVVECNDQVGSAIKITQEGKALTLCEVEVLGQ